MHLLTLQSTDSAVCVYVCVCVCVCVCVVACAKARERDAPAHNTKLVCSKSSMLLEMLCLFPLQQFLCVRCKT